MNEFKSKYMLVILKSPLTRLTLSSLNTALILAAIIMELLPEDTAKIFVMPTLVAAFFLGVSQLYISSEKARPTRSEEKKEI